jgi:hypothetical protein
MSKKIKERNPSENKLNMDVTENFAWLGWLLSAIVLLLLWGIGAVLQNPARLALTGKMTQGTVVDLAKEKDLQAPVVEFKTFSGERITVTGRDFSSFNSTKIGDHLRVAYDTQNPKDAQLFLWSEFALVGILALLITFILLLWISGILVAPDINMGDPLHILTTSIAHLKLSPSRFPLYFMLPLFIFSCGLGTYVLSSRLYELKTKGIIVTGHVKGSTTESSRLSDGSNISGSFYTIEYYDKAGEMHQIRESTARPYSSLSPGDFIQVIYPPDDPKRGVVNTWVELYPSVLFFAFCMCAFTSLAWLFLTGKIQP